MFKEEETRKNITQKKGPRWATNLFRSKDVCNPHLRTLCQQWLHGLLVVCKHIQCIFSSLICTSKQPQEASSTFSCGGVLSDFLFFRFPDEVARMISSFPSKLPSVALHFSCPLMTVQNISSRVSTFAFFRWRIHVTHARESV